MKVRYGINALGFLVILLSLIPGDFNVTRALILGLTPALLMLNLICCFED